MYSAIHLFRILGYIICFRSIAPGRYLNIFIDSITTDSVVTIYPIDT